MVRFPPKFGRGVSILTSVGSHLSGYLIENGFRKLHMEGVFIGFLFPPVGWNVVMLVRALAAMLDHEATCFSDPNIKIKGSQVSDEYGEALSALSTFVLLCKESICIYPE